MLSVTLPVRRERLGVTFPVPRECLGVALPDWGLELGFGFGIAGLQVRRGECGGTAEEGKEEGELHGS